MGGADPRSSSSQGNVITPDLGAGKYWYVDPRARSSGPRGFDPAQDYDEQGHSGMNEPQRIDFINAVNRLMSPNTPMLPMSTPTPTPQPVLPTQFGA
jgi:hypothetical protein